MIAVGIDVAKDKHDCFIMNSEGEVLFNPFVIQNNREGFDSLYEKICSVADDFTKVKVRLEATGHYTILASNAFLYKKTIFYKFCAALRFVKNACW